MLHQIYERNSSVYSVLRVPAPTFPNTLIDDCVQLFDRPQTGLLTTPPPSLQQPSRFLEILKQNHRKNPCLSFKTGGQETLFSVQHFTGTILSSSLDHRQLKRLPIDSSPNSSHKNLSVPHKQILVAKEQ
ncbi:hypothetical protein G6F68_016697 [Rhizopus microsporus]|nr:hypothetical protein G6F68_016697 [Rhizopus microsporus]